MSNPDLLAQAFLDWFTLIYNIPGFEKYIKPEYHNYSYFQNHKQRLIEYYDSKNRKIFDDDGNTLCCITGYKFKIEDVVDMNRDIRTQRHDTDLQMGHNYPRSDDYITIRGFNLLPQTRRGNMIIGEKIFTENEWLDELKNIITFIK